MMSSLLSSPKPLFFKLILVSIYFSTILPTDAFLTASSTAPFTRMVMPSLALSSAATRYQPIIEAIDELFPPKGLDQRIALSRKDGYWPFISSGDEPPQEFVYGEFDVDFFSQVVDRAIELYGKDEAKVFCDLGSGTGRLVLTAAALHNWDLVRGVELLPSIHQQAVEKLNACEKIAIEHAPSPPSPSSQQSIWTQYKSFSPSNDWLNQLSRNFDDDDEEENSEQKLILPPPAMTAGVSESPSEAVSDNLKRTSSKEYFLGHNQELPLAPIKLSCGSFDDPYEFFGDANIVFCFSSAMPYHIIVNMARACGRQCQPGSLIITTEYELPEGGIIDTYEDDSNVPAGNYELELIEELNGFCDATGGESTVFIHRLTKSLGTGNPIPKPKVTVSDIC
jgi:hypothetical protein